MLKGISTLVEYDECIKKGLCEEHLKDINKNDLAAVRNEFPKKAFKFVRVNVLYPFLCGNPPKCEKMKKLMEKTPPIAKALIDGKAGRAVSEEAANVILIMDSVVIFTICQLSKICCIGAIFHTTKNSDDPNINSIQNLLLVERLNADIRYLYPVLQKNFDGFDLAVIRATYCITLLFIRKFCHKRSMKKAIETVENDIITNCDFKEVTVVCSEYSYKNISCVIQKTSTSSSASFNDFYSSKDYVELSNVFYADKKYEIASFYGYLGVSMEDSVGDAYFPFVKALLIQQKFKEAFDVITYGISHCSKNSKQYKQLTKLLGGLSKHINPVPVESTNNVSENSVNHNDIKDKILTNSKENSKSGLVDLVDSDSGESESEVIKELPGSGLNELVVDSDDNSEAVEKKEIKSESKEEQKSKSPECIKENAVAQEVDKLTDTAYSDDESENKKKKQIMCGTKEKTKIKAYTRRKRTISEGSVDNQQEEEIDINKINSYLKEASEALLADCGYKAVQIFRGPLRKFIESSDFLSFEECDIVCIKYSYGIAYCKSGGHDDLEKCITILKDIIENHDSITFPAAHYALGLAFRKLNRFKEALINLEIVQNFLNKGIHFKIYPWPGMTTVIQETKPDILKNLVQDLIKECENPPNPDAFCRYENCSFQPTIYYTDPDFKGYVSLSCSEQCNLQYHLQCWKIMKEEKNLTDKEFLEKPCFTPDCEGFIAKIQNIDKKGDLAKEFTSEFKKPQKLPKKWEKKTDNKEKRKKKIAVKYEGGSEEILTENGKDHSRKSSICENDASENKKEHSRESSICDNETVSQFSGSCISNDEISCKSECDQKSLENLKQKADVPASSSSNFISSSLQENSSINHVDNFKELSIPSEENETELMESIKNNTYSYMADFLQYHGPLRIDDPLLTNEIESFPDEIYNIVSKIGGIGEFLKNDLRFAFVGDLYICIIDDVAKAYQMLSNASLLTDFKNFPPLESTEDSKYYRENGELPDAKHSSFLNPDAQEYTPSSNKNNVYKFTTNNLHQDFDSCCSLPVNLESPSKHPNSVSQLDTFPVTESLVGKSKSCEAVLNNKFQKNAELFASRSKEKSVLLANESVTKSALHSGLLSPESEIVDESSLQNCSDKNTNSLTGSDKSTNDITDDSLRDNAISKQKKMEAELKQVFKQHFDEDILGEEMLKYHKSMVTFLKSKHANNKMEETVSTGTNTDIKFLLEECKNFGNASALDQDNVIEGLKKEIYDLSKQNSSLQNVLECTTEQQQKLTAEVARLKKCLTDSAFKIESMKKEFEKKEKESLKDKETLVQSLTHANKFIGSLQQQNALLSEEKLKLCKTVDEMSLSLKKEEDKRKSSLDAQEKKFNTVIESLQKENAELKNRTKHAEFQLLFMKKNEYLKRIEAKSIEVEEVKKEMNTPSMKLWANAAGPEQMKILSTKLNNYVEELKAIRQDFVEKIDEQIKKVKNGASLKDLKEVVMKDLPPVPNYKNTLPEHLLAGMSRLNSMALPYFGTSAHMPSAAVVPPVPTASLLSSATSSLKITPPSAVSTKMISPISPLAATNVISPLAPIAAANIIPSVPPATAVVPPCAPSMATASLTSLSSSVPSVLNKNKESKIDLVNDIDPTIQESFKNAMASINSFASSPYPVPSLDDEFDKKCVVFKHPDPVSSDIKPDHPKVPPGLVNSVPHSASARASAITPIPEPKLEAYNASGNKSYASLDAVPKIKVAANQSTWETEKKKTTTASYSKLLNKLKEQFPTYTQEELISYVKEVRAQRQGKLSGLTIDAIISEISAIMKAKKKMPEPKVQPKPAKVLVNKKLASDPKLAPQEPQVTTKKKTAWNIDTEAALRKFSGSADDDCTICYDSMENSAYKVACGHFFHEDCIRQWLKKNSNCPICRVLLLLPEEYPSLS